jgi:error-prone DNA polymerase
VFQVESRAQMSMLPRLKPETFYDLVIEVAIVRPGPIQGDMVHPYLKRRRGQSRKPTYPSPDPAMAPTTLEGRPAEDARRAAVPGAGDADRHRGRRLHARRGRRLRRAMATFKRNGTIHKLRDKFIGGMTRAATPRLRRALLQARSRASANTAFPKATRRASPPRLRLGLDQMPLPGRLRAALLNSQPMGFYAPAQLVRDAREHGVEVRAVDVNFSDWDCTLELPQNARIMVAGVVLVRQQPGTAKGVIFMTLEDETDIANLIIWPKVFAANRRIVMTGRFLAVRGRLQRAGLVVHVVAEQFIDLSNELARLAESDLADPPLLKSRDFH